MRNRTLFIYNIIPIQWVMLNIRCLAIRVLKMYCEIGQYNNICPSVHNYCTPTGTSGVSFY